MFFTIQPISAYVSLKEISLISQLIASVVQPLPFAGHFLNDQYSRPVLARDVVKILNILEKNPTIFRQHPLLVSRLILAKGADPNALDSNDNNVCHMMVILNKVNIMIHDYLNQMPPGQ